MQERLSILAMTKYNPHIWDGFNLPSGANRQEAIDYICFQCAEIGLVYTEPASLKEAIRIWTSANRHSWDRVWLALNENYNPLHNYDRYEEWADDSTGSSSATTGGTVTGKVAGFNQSAGLATRDESTSSGSSSGTSTDYRSHTGHLYGNIGVTTSATMLKEELEIRQNHFYEIVCQAFKNNFCVQVY